MRQSGVVAKWNDERGFGFIKSESGGPDHFLHIKAFQHGSERPLDGMTVTFDSEVNRQGQLRAERVVVMGDKWSLVPAARRVGTRVIGYVAVGCFAAIMALEILFWGMPTWALAIYGGASLLSFVLYWQDKRAAIAHTWRIPEEQLHLLGLIGGWPGGLLAQILFRHKTQKERFARFFWFTVLLNVLAFVAIGTIIHFDWIARIVATQ